MRYLILPLFFGLSAVLFAQPSSNFNSSKNWSMHKKEVFFAAGATQLLGDLGGRDRIGTQNSLVDWDWAAIRYGVAAGYRYRFHPRWATSTKLQYGLLSGDDAHTNEIIRNSRNLSVRTHVVELSQRMEFIVLANERAGARYRMSGVQGARPKADRVYLFAGIGGLFFNPQSRVNGSWTNLHPLRTEGQGLPGGPAEYSRFTASVPLGIGFTYGISALWRIGMELSYQITFTDYLDDVSTDYYDPEVLAAQFGPQSALAANPAIANHAWFGPGQQRGNPDDNDAYFFANITLTRNITYPASKRGKTVKWKGRTKF